MTSAVKYIPALKVLSLLSMYCVYWHRVEYLDLNHCKLDPSPGSRGGLLGLDQGKSHETGGLGPQEIWTVKNLALYRGLHGSR